MKHTCTKCQKETHLRREDIRYWPDHLWAGAIQANFPCPKCEADQSVWAHDLPQEWRADWEKYNWPDYAMRRLLFSCELNGIKPDPEPRRLTLWQTIKRDFL